MNKGAISNLLRRLRLIYITDLIRYRLERRRNHAANRKFRKDHPEVALPPDYLIYESFQMNYEKYYASSLENTKWLVGIIRRHIDLKDKAILDWGCGPGRIIRHMPAVVGNGCRFYGTDYNAASIAWCTRNLPGIQFNRNDLEARLPYSDAQFDVIYGISIFTHLSEQLHYDWYRELSRVLKPGGILLLTTQGDNFKPKLSEVETKAYTSGALIVRGNVKEGHRTYSAFHPKGFMQKLFSDARIEEHIELEAGTGKYVPQDIWVVRKK